MDQGKSGGMGRCKKFWKLLRRQINSLVMVWIVWVLISLCRIAAMAAPGEWGWREEAGMEGFRVRGEDDKGWK